MRTTPTHGVKALKSKIATSLLVKIFVNASVDILNAQTFFVENKIEDFREHTPATSATIAVPTFKGTANYTDFFRTASQGVARVRKSQSATSAVTSEMLRGGLQDFPSLSTSRRAQKERESKR